MNKTESSFGLQNISGYITADEGRTFLKSFDAMSGEEWEELYTDIENYLDKELTFGEIHDLKEILSQNDNQYTIVVEKDEDGYFVKCPELPELQGYFSQGETIEKALENIQDAIKLHLADRSNIKYKVSYVQENNLAEEQGYFFIECNDKPGTPEAVAVEEAIKRGIDPSLLLIPEIVE